MFYIIIFLIGIIVVLLAAVIGIKRTLEQVQRKRLAALAGEMTDDEQHIRDAKATEIKESRKNIGELKNGN